MNNKENAGSNDEQFTPDAVDQQIDTMLSPGASAQQKRSGERVIYDLSALYSGDATSLDRIWERLAEHRAFANDGAQSEESRTVHEGGSTRNPAVFPMIRRERPLLRRLSMIAAVACALLLVGSLVIVLNMTRRPGSVTVIHPANTFCTPSGKSSNPPAPVIFERQAGQSGLYLAEDNGIYRYGLQDGHLSPLWEYRLNGCTATPTIAPGLENGPRPPVPGVTTAVTVAKDVVYFGVREDTGTYLYAAHTLDGSLVWKAKVDLLKQPLVLNNFIYIQTTDNAGHDVIMALSTLNGSVRWSYPYTPAATDQSEGLGATGDGKVYVSTSNMIFALDALTGKQVWSLQIESGQIISAMRFLNGALYATASSTCFNCQALAGTSAAYAFHPAKGLRLWETQKVAGYLSAPVEMQGVIYFGSIDGYVHAVFVNNGQQLWQSYAGGEIRAAPQVVNGVVYVGAGLFLGVGDPNTDKAHILALDAAHGGKKWSFAIPDAQYDDSSPLVAANGVVYISTLSGYIYFVHAGNGTLIQRYLISDIHAFVNGISPTLTLVP